MNTVKNRASKTTMKMALSAVILGSLLSAGCAKRASDSIATGPTSAPRSTSAGASYDKAAPSPASPPSESAAAPRAEAEARPGLGTSWGEQIDSRITSTSFYRQDPGSPSAVASFFYNDESGVAAMARGRFVDWRESTTALGRGNVRVSLVDSGGSPLRAADVDGRLIAVGSQGDRYMIHVENRSSSRVEIVATVDGLDVMDGDDGDFHKRGYVVSPYGTLDIEGFRESSGSVRAFRFGATDDSYASQRGKGRNVGVVGVAVFAEQGSYGLDYSEEEMERRETADPFPRRFAPPPPTSYGSRWR